METVTGTVTGTSLYKLSGGDYNVWVLRDGARFPEQGDVLFRVTGAHGAWHVWQESPAPQHRLYTGVTLEQAREWVRFNA